MTRNRVALVRFIESRACTPHAFGSNDCVRFVLDAVEAQFGVCVDAGATWSDERTARRAIAKLGGFEATVDRLFPRIAIGEASLGDIAGVEDPELGFHVMLVEGAALVAPSNGGLIRVPRRQMIAAWTAKPKEMGLV